MAAQRVQRYLDKHKIGPLFESLMAQVIQETPEDPIGYIITILQDMHKKQHLANDLIDNDPTASSRSPSRKSVWASSQNETKEQSSRSNHLAASWSASASEPPVHLKSREYQRPKTSNRKSFGNQTWSPEEKSRHTRDDGRQRASGWNNDTRVPTHDFDELLQLQNEAEPERSHEAEVRKDKYRGVKSWNAKEEDIHEKQKESGDGQVYELDNELKLGMYKKSKSPNDEHVRAVSPVSRSRPIKARRAVEEHRQQLQALLLEEDKDSTRGSRNMKYSPEDGMEILENIEELEEEGCKKTTRKGAKINKLKRNQSNENVAVTICARCARIIGKEDGDNSSSEVQSVFNDTNGLSFDRFTRKDNLLDSFDTRSETSEIMGNASLKNTWPVASDTESDITPRGNKMFKPTQSSPEQKLKHMYRRDKVPSPEPSSAPSTSRSKLKGSVAFANSAGKSWGVNDFSSDNETEVERTSRPSDNMSGQPWEIPSDNNSDIESKMSRRPAKSGFPKSKRAGHRSRAGFSFDTSSSVGDTDY